MLRAARNNAWRLFRLDHQHGFALLTQSFDVRGLRGNPTVIFNGGDWLREKEMLPVPPVKGKNP